MKCSFPLIKSLLFLALMVCSEDLQAQALLQKVVRLSVDNAPLAEVLKSIGRQGDFSFSYNSNAVAGKRLVTIHASAITVEKALDELLKGTCNYKEVGNHIVLQASKEKYYQVSGYVLDAASGQGLAEASVYERQQLVGTVTNSEGFFKLRLRHQYPTADISISKYLYQDTTIFLASVDDQVYRLPVRQAVPHELDEVTVSGNPDKNVFDNFLSKLFLNNNLKTQTRNISRFIAERPVQTSFVPGLGTHGKLSAQVVNKFSLNILGGYSAGVDGVEIGGLFNIDRGNVRYTQVAGLFNVVGGRMDGVQISGLSNTVQDTVNGVQVAGLSNYSGRRVDGVLVAGVVNVAADSVSGVQVAGVMNTGRQIDGTQVAGVASITNQVSGAQISGVANITARTVQGTQVAGVFNYARRLKGVQIGLINVADTSDGISFGLINIAGNGYHKMAVYSDEVIPLNVALKTGMPALYTILFGGFNPDQSNQVASFGAGLGNQAIFSRHWSMTTEATVQHLYLGQWDAAHLLYRARVSLCFQPNRWISIYAGPSISGYEKNQEPAGESFLKDPASKGYYQFDISDTHIGWFGWQFGVAFF